MLTLYHAPQSRSNTIISLLYELDVMDRIRVRTVTIPRQDGSGGRDPANPHPEGKVPYLVNGDDHLRERGAIIVYLTDLFPEAGLAPLPGDPKRGEYLSWLFWYQGVLEPVAVLQFAGLSHPALQATFRNYPTALEQLDKTLTRQPWLLGDKFSAADLLVASPFIFFGDVMPSTPAITEWAGRIQSRPSQALAAAFDG
ncbi:glutathione S-transferase family protein [Paracoccus sp. CPCC 101403]|uniref:Glutathione S-transferase family protein n=1 Tax=Paracoccus broussonetiae TaxID=3075834 RepID=A0ABU3EJJ1_9RHOB|nr:glutathione S-transferase family protein [Paracoccus sp. CPCC 101403]MDT1064413.1 glutathione S-transferase family protein [Paracoccus sp. CPCC 101403]